MPSCDGSNMTGPGAKFEFWDEMGTAVKIDLLDPRTSSNGAVRQIYVVVNDFE